MCMMTISVFAKKQIDLDGMWTPTHRTVPIYVSIEETTQELLLTFLEPLDNILVTITDQNNKIIYREEFSVEKGKVWTISLRDYAITSGVISISDGKGNYVWGNF